MSAVMYWFTSPRWCTYRRWRYHYSRDCECNKCKCNSRMGSRREEQFSQPALLNWWISPPRWTISGSGTGWCEMFLVREHLLSLLITSVKDDRGYQQVLCYTKLWLESFIQTDIRWFKLDSFVTFVEGENGETSIAEQIWRLENSAQPSNVYIIISDRYAR